MRLLATRLCASIPILSRILYVGVFVICSSSLCSLPCLVSQKQKDCHINTHPDAGTIFLPITYCGPCTLPKFVYTSPSLIGPNCGVSRCAAPTHLWPCPLLHHVSILSPLHMWSRFLSSKWISLWSATKRWLLRGGWGVSPECALREEYLRHNLDEQCSENTGVPYMPWCSPCLASGVWGGTIPLAPRSFSVRGAWLLERVRPVDACQPTNSELFLLAGSARTRP